MARVGDTDVWLERRDALPRIDLPREQVSKSVDGARVELGARASG